MPDISSKYFVGQTLAPGMIKKSGWRPARRLHLNVYCTDQLYDREKGIPFCFESRNRARDNSAYIYTLYGADGSAKNSKFVLRFGGKQATRRHSRMFNVVGKESLFRIPTSAQIVVLALLLVVSCVSVCLGLSAAASNKH